MNCPLVCQLSKTACVDGNFSNFVTNMPPLLCSSKCGQRAVLKRPKTGDALCKDCFFWAFETEIHFTITKAKLFKPGDYVAIGASGGKDSTVLAHVMKTLNERFNYGLKLVLLSIDEGISGYRDDSLETVKRNRDQYGLPLKILSYQAMITLFFIICRPQAGRYLRVTYVSGE